jgi:hypothetical protein
MGADEADEAKSENRKRTERHMDKRYPLNSRIAKQHCTDAGCPICVHLDAHKLNVISTFRLLLMGKR